MSRLKDFERFRRLLNRATCIYKVVEKGEQGGHHQKKFFPCKIGKLKTFTCA